METVKDLNRKKYFRSRFEIWKQKKKKEKEELFENKTTYNLSKK